MVRVWQAIRGNPLLWLLVFVPMVLLAEHLGPRSGTLMFVLTELAIVPLAALLSQATEAVAARTGDTVGGLQDLKTAAALEPNRSLLRSYLGKGFANAGDALLATHELELARQLDPHDPTSWLYAALLNQQQYRFNQGIRDTNV